MNIERILNNQKTIYTKGDYYSFCKNEQKGVKIKFYFSFVATLVSLVAYSLFAYEAVGFMREDQDVIRMVLISGFLLFGAVMYFYRINNLRVCIKNMRRGKKNNSFGNEDNIHVTVDEQGVCLYNHSRRMLYKWEELKGLYDNKEDIYIVYSGQQVVKLPKSFLGNQDRLCMQILKNHRLGKAYGEVYLLPEEEEENLDQPLLEIQSVVTEELIIDYEIGTSGMAYFRKLATIFGGVLFIHGVGMMMSVYLLTPRMIDKGILALSGLYILYGTWIRAKRQAKAVYESLPTDKLKVRVQMYEDYMIVRNAGFVHYLPYINIGMQTEGKKFYSWKAKSTAYIIDKKALKSESEEKMFKKTIGIK